MNAPNPPNAPGSDIFEKNMNGIDLRSKQDNLFNVEIPRLWRKKRDISSSKVHFQR
jgi:hypothetical protein